MKSFFFNIITIIFCLSLSNSIHANSLGERKLARCVLHTYCHQLPPNYITSSRLKKDKSAHRLIYSFLRQNNGKNTMDTVYVLTNTTEFIPYCTHLLYKDSVLEFMECYSDVKHSHYLCCRRCAYDEVFTRFYYDLLQQWSKEVIILLGKKAMNIEVDVFDVARMICKNGKCVSVDILCHEAFDEMSTYNMKILLNTPIRM